MSSAAQPAPGSRAIGRLARLAVVTLAVLALASCASTRFSQVWRDPGYGGGPLTKVVVFVVAKGESVRRFAEDQAVRAMPKGTQAVASWTLFDKPEGDMERVKARLAQEGFDGAIVAHEVAVDKIQSHVPPSLEPHPIGPVFVRPNHRSFYGYYTWAYGYTYRPGYTIETTKVLVETLVYTLPEGRPVWSGVSETINPESTVDLVEQLVRVTRTELQRAGLIAAPAAR